MRRVLLVVGAVVVIGLIVAAILAVRNRRQPEPPADQVQVPSLPTLSLQPLVETTLNFAAVESTGQRLIYLEADTNVVKQLTLADGSTETIARIPKVLSPVAVVWSTDLSFGLIDALEEGGQDRRFYLLKKSAKEIVKLDPKIVAAHFIGSGKQYLAQKLTDDGSEFLVVDLVSGETSTIGRLGTEPRVIRPLVEDQAVILPNTKENGREKIVIYEGGQLRDLGAVELGTIDLIPLDGSRAIVDLFNAENVTYQLAVLDLTTGQISDIPIEASITDVAYNPDNQQLLAKLDDRLITYLLDTGQSNEVAQDEQVRSIQRIIIVPTSGNILLQIENKLFELSI